MAYVGTPLDTTNAFQSLAGKRFSGDASTTDFTLDSSPNSTLDIEVFVGNVRQDPNSAYTVSGTISADQLAYGLANEVSTFAGARFVATRVATNTLRLSSKVAGFRLAGTVFFINGAIVVNNISTISTPRRTITLTGTITADPGIYDYTITTDGGGVNCNNISRVGRITVTGQSSITLGVGSDDAQEICFGDPINAITYPINYANFALCRCSYGFVYFCAF